MLTDFRIFIKFYNLDVKNDIIFNKVSYSKRTVYKKKIPLLRKIAYEEPIYADEDKESYGKLTHIYL
ncbi:MAG TPA: hypothetical protein GX708_07500 [Gallicola sp.]|nr:hypothetical protein [Gallicola sp.]